SSSCLGVSRRKARLRGQREGRYGRRGGRKPGFRHGLGAVARCVGEQEPQERPRGKERRCEQATEAAPDEDRSRVDEGAIREGAPRWHTRTRRARGVRIPDRALPRRKARGTEVSCLPCCGVRRLRDGREAVRGGEGRELRDKARPGDDDNISGFRRYRSEG